MGLSSAATSKSTTGKQPRRKGIGRRNGDVVTAHVYGFKRYIWGETFRFGYDKPVATARCMSVLALKATLESQGAKGWTLETRVQAWEIAKGANQTATTTTTKPSTNSGSSHESVDDNKPSEKRTVYSAIDAYLVHVGANDIAPGDTSYSGRVRALKRAIVDMPMQDVGAKELIGLVRYWKSKPNGTQSVYDHANRAWKVIDSGVPLSAISVKKYIGAARQAFTWIASDESGFEWNAPNLKGIFEFRNVELEKLKGAAEDMADITAIGDEKSIHFTFEELNSLYSESHRGNRRLYFLLAMNCGFCTSELTGLRVGNCFIYGENSEKPFILFKRPKTKIRGKWYLWKDTATELRKHLTGNADAGEVKSLDRVFLTEDGLPLVNRSQRKADGTGGNRNDAVKLVWNRWARTAKVNRLSWKNMRKTASQFVRQSATKLGLNGDYMSEMFLAHVAPAMSRHYNERDNAEFSKLGEALAEVRKMLTFIGGPKNVVVSSAANAA